VRRVVVKVTALSYVCFIAVRRVVVKVTALSCVCFIAVRRVVVKVIAQRGAVPVQRTLNGLQGDGGVRFF
jgi:hypothetical protein